MILYWGSHSSGKGEIERTGWINDVKVSWVQPNDIRSFSSVYQKISKYKYNILLLKTIVPYNKDSLSVIQLSKKELNYENYNAIGPEDISHIQYFKPEENINDFKVPTRYIPTIKNWKEPFENNEIDILLSFHTAPDKLDYFISKATKHLLPYRKYNYGEEDIAKLIDKLQIFDTKNEDIFKLWKKSKKIIFNYLDHYIRVLRNTEMFLIKNNIPFEYYNLDDPNRFDVFGYKNTIDFHFHHTPYDLSNSIVKEKYEMARQMAIEWFEYRKITDTRIKYAPIDGLIL